MQREVVTNSVTVWVNVGGVCVGRFSPAGAELRDAEGGVRLLPIRWKVWVDAIFVLHAVEVASIYRPEWERRIAE